ncbi:MAG: hypothetical protein JST00_10070 [Deltaproteobacteria bacterium]|nr:hypothetical protein [Deltaproteobacteria bacterium]
MELRSGQLRAAKKSAWNGDTYDVVCRSAGDRELFRLRDVSGGLNNASLLALGANVAQADLDT